MQNVDDKKFYGGFLNIWTIKSITMIIKFLYNSLSGVFGNELMLKC